MYEVLAAGFDIDTLTTEVNSATHAKNFSNIGQLLNGFGGSIGIVTILFFVAGAALLFYLLQGGFKLMSSDGDPKKVAEAREIIYNGFVGILIVIFSYWIVQLVGIVLGLSDFTRIF